MLVTLYADEADRQRRLAAAHTYEAQLALARDASHERGGDGEALVRDLLAPLAAEGWQLLHRRRCFAATTIMAGRHAGLAGESGVRSEQRR